jgi:hypothetical protein
MHHPGFPVCMDANECVSTSVLIKASIFVTAMLCPAGHLYVLGGFGPSLAGTEGEKRAYLVLDDQSMVRLLNCERVTKNTRIETISKAIIIKGHRWGPLTIPMHNSCKHLCCQTISGMYPLYLVRFSGHFHPPPSMYPPSLSQPPFLQPTNLQGSRPHL